MCVYYIILIDIIRKLFLYFIIISIIYTNHLILL